MRGTPRTCVVAGCANRHDARGLCKSHYNRSLRAGSLPPAQDPSTEYNAIHERIRNARGSATLRRCAADGCRAQADHWAWNRMGPSRSGFRNGSAVKWGTDESTYSAMCATHGRQLDRGGTLTHCPNGHLRSEAGARPNGHCRACHRESTLAAWHRKQQPPSSGKERT